MADIGLVSASPTVQTVAASSVTTTSAMLNSTVHPNGSSTTIYFQYGTTVSYGSNKIPHQETLAQAPAISALQFQAYPWNTTYHFRIVASNGTGTSDGNDLTFTTSVQQVPTAQTLSATSVTTTSAMLNSFVNPNGASTTIYFQYGTTTSYGSTTISGAIGTTSGNYGTSISGLSPNTLYHFRIVASNNGGMSSGSDLTFTTSGKRAICFNPSSNLNHIDVCTVEQLR